MPVRSAKVRRGPRPECKATRNDGSAKSTGPTSVRALALLKSEHRNARRLPQSKGRRAAVSMAARSDRLRIMSRKVLSRKEKETRYIEKSMELQRVWGNPIGRHDEAICQHNAAQMTDEELDKEIANSVSQIQFEKGMAVAKTVIKTTVGIFVALGVSGLLVFGVKQLVTLLK